MKNRAKRSRSFGFTLLEMTIALMMSMGIAATLVIMIQQHVSLTQVIGKFAFLRDEAPQINTLLTTMINKADFYRIYSSVDNAKNGTNPVRSDGRALRLRFRNPDGSSNLAIIAFENRNNEKQLNFYRLPPGSSSWPANPSWTITKEPSEIDFDNTSGILLVTMTGQNGDEITYAGNPD